MPPIRFVPALALLLLLQVVQLAAPAAAQQSARPADPDAWRFDVTVYGWLVSASGNTTARGQTVDYNASFPQLVQDSDSLAAWMSYFEAGKGKVGFYTDFVWTKLGFTNGTASYRNPLGGLQLSSAATRNATLQMTIVESGGLYELARWGGGDSGVTTLDGLLGFRLWNTQADLWFDRTNTVDFSRLGFEVSRSFAIAHTGGLTWVDPVVGLRLRHAFTPHQQVTVRGDVGGFGLQSTFAWQAVAAYSYQWMFNGGGSMAALIGYRALSTNYSTGSGLDTRGLDILLHGPVVGVSFRF